MMGDNDIKVKCKKCNKSVPTSELTLDPVFKMMVCQSCVKERLQSEKVHEELKAQKEMASQTKAIDAPKPAGWDAEDEILEKLSKEKGKHTVSVEKISDEKVRYTCPKCKYQFAYNIVRKSPGSCPYCGSPIFNFRI